MLFKNRELQSCYDFDQEVPDEKANLLSLAKEIYEMTDILCKYYSANEIIELYYPDLYDHKVYMDFHNVENYTWNRSVNEIQQLLYRKKINGKFQNQFSINKALDNFHVEEPKHKQEYKAYLQILYFFYFLHYFIYPKVNIFSMFNEENMSYLDSYDHSSYSSFIMYNLQSNQGLLSDFCEECDYLDETMKNIDLKLRKFISSDEVCIYLSDLISEADAFVDKNKIDEDAKLTLMDYFHYYSMYTYCHDLLLNLNAYKNTLDDLKLIVFPPAHWQNLYLNLQTLDDFIMSDELYAFCKQTYRKVEVRDKIKF